MKLNRLNKDLFNNDHYSRNELNLFTSDFISRCKKMITPILSAAELAITETIYKKFTGTLGELSTAGAFQKGGFITKQDAYDDALDFIKTKEGQIKSTFTKESAAYMEFYPQGLTQYHRATVEGMKTLLASYAEVAEKYKAKLGNDFITELDIIRQQYSKARDEQVDKKTDHATTQSRLRESRKQLTAQLTKCLLLIAAYTVDNDETYNSYFNSGLLEVDNDKHIVDDNENSSEIN